MSKDEEENLYRKCLADKFPNISQTDYIECTNKIHNDRIEILTNFLGDVAEKTLDELH
jgi:hypothetical protein